MLYMCGATNNTLKIKLYKVIHHIRCSYLPNATQLIVTSGVLEHKWRASLMLGNKKLSIVTMF